ncbi:uncharacterized protein LOC122303956 [Carya illinoinensis]|nr:uncharacterized protein LOC122303956 [Carya illinoinensis]
MAFLFYFFILFIFFFFFFFLLVDTLVLRRREILNLHSFHPTFTPPLLKTRAPLAQLHPEMPLPLSSATPLATPLPIPRMTLPLSSAAPHSRFIKCVTISDGAVGKTRYEASHLRNNDGDRKMGLDSTWTLIELKIYGNSCSQIVAVGVGFVFVVAFVYTEVREVQYFVVILVWKLNWCISFHSCMLSYSS